MKRKRRRRSRRSKKRSRAYDGGDVSAPRNSGLVGIVLREKENVGKWYVCGTKGSCELLHDIHMCSAASVEHWGSSFTRT